MSIYCMMGGVRKWLTLSQPTMELLILLNLELSKLPKLWLRVFNRMLLSKHQVLIWHCHHNAVYTGNVLCHYITDHSGECISCGKELEDIDHHFQRCPHISKLIWNFINNGLSTETTQDSASQFWQGLPPGQLVFPKEFHLLAWSAGLWCIYRAHMDAHLNNTPITLPAL